MELSSQLIVQVGAPLAVLAVLWLGRTLGKVQKLVQNGIHTDVKGLRDEFRTYRAEQRDRWQESEGERFLMADRLEKTSSRLDLIERQVEWTGRRER